ncbi:MAG: VOC family protein [Actinobacteria bacterium]|nr:VOC family protein [Actinomycetota bacterium]
MTDPFSVLRAPVTPADPDPGFAARLRARLARAFDLPEGVEMSGTATTISGTGSGQAAPERGAAIPYLAVRDARQAIGWYVRVLGGRLRGDPITMPDGRIGHAEIELGPGVLYLADEHPEIGARAPEPGGSPVSLVLTVTGLDAVVAAATREGGSLDRGPYEGYGHRNATVTDPFGHRWMLQEPLPAGAGAAAPGPALRPGDVVYASLQVPDTARAAAFYATVLGWEYEPGQDARGRQVAGGSPAQGLWGGQPRSTLFCSYVVEDVAAAVARVRAAGGMADDPTRRPYGLVADCTDDQGVRFAVHQAETRPATGNQAETGPGAGSQAETGPGAASQAETGPGAARDQPGPGRDGDLVYVTMEVPDSARARGFYGSVLGWRVTPGHVADGWQVEGVTPPAGISGGHPEATLVPVWQVTDVSAAAVRVRAAGGTATEPHAEPYGRICECTDDQGTRFSLVQ